MHILLLGNFGSTNIGDEALLESLLLFLSKEQHAIHILSAQPQDTRERYSYTYTITTSHVFPAGIRSMIKTTLPFLSNLPKVLRCSHVFFGGGGLLTDSYSLYPMFLWWMQFFFLHTLLRKKVCIIGQSFPVPRTKLGRWMLSYILRRSDPVLVRDSASERVATQHGASHVTYLPDLAFFLPPHAKNEAQRKNGHIALSLRPDTYTTEHMLATLADAIGGMHPVHIHLVPMQFVKEEDVTVLQHFGATYLTPKNITYTVHHPKTYTDVEAILSTCAYALGMRLHFSIFALRTHTQILPLSYSPKIAAMFAKWNIPTLDMQNITKDQLLSLMTTTSNEPQSTLWEEERNDAQDAYRKHIDTFLRK